MSATDENYDFERTLNDFLEHSAVVIDDRPLMVRNREFELPPPFPIAPVEKIDIREQFETPYEELVEIIEKADYFFQNPEEIERFERENYGDRSEM